MHKTVQNAEKTAHFRAVFALFFVDNDVKLHFIAVFIVVYAIQGISTVGQFVKFVPYGFTIMADISLANALAIPFIVNALAILALTHRA